MRYERGWFEGSRRRPGASRRIVCLPFAGGGSAAYRAWPAAAPPDVEILAVQPPGRGGRHREPAITDLVELAEAVADALAPEGDVPLTLFGHSQGAVLAFEVCRALRRRPGAPQPDRLVVSASAPPGPDDGGRAADRRAVASMSDDELVALLARLGGTPPEVLAHPELLRMVLPAVRADFVAGERYRYLPEEPLTQPVVVLGALDDALVPDDALSGWEARTTGPVVHHRLPAGGHFAVVARPDWVLNLIG